MEAALLVKAEIIVCAACYYLVPRSSTTVEHATVYTGLERAVCKVQRHAA